MSRTHLGWLGVAAMLAGLLVACSPKPITTGKFGAGVASKIEKVPVPASAIFDVRPDPVIGYSIPNEDDLVGLAQWYKSRFPLNKDWERGWTWCDGSEADAKGEGFRRAYRKGANLLVFGVGGATTINNQHVLTISIALAPDQGTTC